VSVAAMIIILSDKLAVPIPAPCTEDGSRHDRYSAILRFSGTYANVKWSSISNSNEELGADPDNRVITSGFPTSRVLRKGGAE
jgi:hypothetical protein